MNVMRVALLYDNALNVGEEAVYFDSGAMAAQATR